MPVDLWSRGYERLAAELPEQQFNTWIRPLPTPMVAEAQGDDGARTVVSLAVPNRFKLTGSGPSTGRIETVLGELAGKPVRLELTLHRPVAEVGAHGHRSR